MKYWTWVLLLAAVACAVPGWAQQREFRYSFGGDRNEIGRSIATNGREQFFIWGDGSSAPGAGAGNAILIRTDSAGRTQVYKEYYTPGGREMGYSIKKVGDFLYMWGTSNNATSTDKLYLMKTRLDGTPVWQKFYETHASSTVALNLTPMPNGDFVAVTNHNFVAAEIYRFDSTGTMLWRRKIANASSFSQFYCVRPTADGNLAVSGAIDNRSYLAKLTPDGDIIWSTEFSTSGGLTSAKSFVELPDGDFFINGYCNVNGRDVMMARVSPTGTRRWTKFFDRTGGYQDVNYGISLDLDSNILITGYTYEGPGGGGQDFVMGKFTPDGDFLWGKALSGPNDDFVDNGPDHVLPIGEDVYVAMGASASSAGGTQGTDFVLFRFSQETNTECFSGDYSLTPVQRSVSGGPASWTLPLQTLLTPVDMQMQTLDGDLCKRIACRPEAQVFDSLGPDETICTNSRDYPARLDAGNFGASYLWSTGETTRTISVTQAGIYKVHVQSGCGLFDDSIRVSFVAPPSIAPPLQASGPLRFCAGGAVRLRTIAAPPGMTLRWTGGSTDTAITVTRSGKYVVRFYNEAGCYTESQVAQVIVDSNPRKPIIQRSGPLSFCQGGRVRLRTPRGTGNSLLWSNGFTDTAQNVTTSGSYAVRVQTAGGCQAFSASVEIATLPAPTPPQLTASGPLTFCEGGAVTLRAQGLAGGDTLRWSTGSGDTVLTVAASGRYAASVVNAAGCRAVSDTVAVTVNANPAQPVIRIEGRAAFCPGQQARLRLTDSLPDTETAVWSTGAAGPVIIARDSGDYAVTVTNAAGCALTSAPFLIRLLRQPSPVLDWLGRTTPCADTLRTFVVTNILASDTVRWGNRRMGDTLRVSAAGVYGVAVTSTEGCTARLSGYELEPRPAPPAVVPSGPTEFCRGDSVRLLARANIVDGGGHWLVGPFFGAEIVVKDSGTYLAETITFSNCRSAPTAFTVAVHAIPAAPAIASATPLGFCQGGQVTLTATGLADTDTARWSSGARTFSITTDVGGTYSLQAVSRYGCVSAPDSATVTVFALPGVPVVEAAGPATFCQGDSVRLRVVSPILGTETLTWPDGSHQPVFTARAGGSYPLEVRNLQACVRLSDPIQVTVNRRPADNPTLMALSGPACEGNVAQIGLQNPVDPRDTVRWSNGATGPSILSPAAGDYWALIASPEGCLGYSDTVTVFALPPVPAIGAGGPLAFCYPGRAQLIATNVRSSDTWQWLAPPRDSLVQENVITLDVDTTLTLVIEATTVQGCKARSAPATVTAHLPPARPRLSILGPRPLCADTDYVLRPEPLAPTDTVRWSTGLVADSLPTRAAGTYWATVVTPFGCTAQSDTVAINSRPMRPLITAGGPTTFCQAGRVRLTVGSVSNFDRYRWLGGPADSLGIWVDTSGTFVVEATNPDGCTNRSVPVPVTVNRLPGSYRIVAFGPPCAQDVRELTTLPVVEPGETLTWSTGATGAPLPVSAAGLYTGVVRNGFGCERPLDTLIIHANPPRPVLTASAPGRLCYGERLRITASNVGDTVRLRWTRGPADSLAINADTTFGYALRVTSPHGCAATSDTLPVRFYDPTLPTLLVAASAAVPCQGDSVVLLADGPDPIRWTIDGRPDAFTGRRIVTRASATYVAQAGGVNTCLLPVSDTARVVIHPRPVIEAGPHLDACEGDTLTLGAFAPQPGVDYRWATPTADPLFTEARPRIEGATPYQPGGAPESLPLYLRAVYPATGCAAVDTTSLYVHSRYELKGDGYPYCQKAPLLIPNVVTPNGDGRNETFRLDILDFYQESTLVILNRYGREVYRQSPYANGWAGEGLPAGTYFYRLLVPAPGWEFKGWVEVVK